MNVRKDFLILQRAVNGRKLVYLDNAATTQKPVQVVDAVKGFYENHCGNLGRGVHTLALEATEMYEDVRKKVAKFIGARKPEEIVFTNNTTHGINTVALGLRETRSVTTTVMEHHSNYVPWKRAAGDFRVADIDESGNLDMQGFRERCKGADVVAAAHVSNVLGTVNPARELAEMAHEQEAVFVLDAAQSAAHMGVDVKKLDCDFMVFSGHKMLGPTGVGVLYGRYGLLEELEPPFVGGGTVSAAEPKIEFLKPPRDLEAGTQNIAGVIGLGAAIDYLKAVGMDRIRKHEDKLTRHAVGGLEGAEVYGPDERAGIISFNLPGKECADVAAALDENGIAVRSGQHCAQPLMRRLGIDGCARMSFYIYNTKEEVDYTLGVLEKIKKLSLRPSGRSPCPGRG